MHRFYENILLTFGSLKKDFVIPIAQQMNSLLKKYIYLAQLLMSCEQRVPQLLL